MTQLRFRWFVVTFVALGCVLFGASHAWSQATNTGTVVGTITDPSGAVIAGADITLASNVGTLRTVSNSTGQYILTTVPPGTYTVTARKNGFSTARAVGVVVQLGQQSTVNLHMAVGSAQETVEVQVTGEELQTLNSTVSQTLGTQQLSSLPSLNHDANTFTTLQPGVSVEGGDAGAVNDQNTFLLDGGNDTNDMDGGNNVYMTSFAGDPTGGQAGMTLSAIPTGALPTPTDSVQEATINTANQTADFDNSAGAQVEFVTPRGTNQWHGGAYEYYLSSGLGANNWENNQTDSPLADYHYNRFGAKAGGFILPSKWGGRTYLWAWYEGLRFPNATTVEATVPSAAMEAGMLTENGATYDMKSIDPRGIGINPDVQAMWSKYEPVGNDTTCSIVDSLAANGSAFCDGVNTIGYKANVSLPQTSNDAAVRLDHDFGARWHWFASYRLYRLNLATDTQYDVGGFFPGDTKGTFAPLSSRPQTPSYYVTGLTTNITPNTTNDLHFSFLRDYWQWGDDNAPPQLPGLGGAMEPAGESSEWTVLAPFNVNAQDIRTRFWDGQDSFLGDNVSMLKGNHLLQFGGQFQHNYDYHQRSDNGGGINFTTTYQLGDTLGGGIVSWSDLGGGFPITNTQALRQAAEVYGIVTDSQVAYVRSGPTLALQPPLTHAFDQSDIDYYNAYVSDTWHLKPSLTVNYGMGYTLEMPPVEKNGKQTVLVDTAGEPVRSADYLTERKTLAEQGAVYNPTLGFALVGNVGAGLKYPYNPFYGSFSPRVGIAWNPSFSKATVIRGGYGRIYGRLNGVDLVLVPLLGDGLMQAVQCTTATAPSGSTPATCAATAATAQTAFRIGVDGNAAPLPAAAPTAPQPIYPGINQSEGSAYEAMDPAFRPNAVDSFDLTVQRQVGQKMLLQVGYIGRIIRHEYQPVNLNAVPYMMSVNGQQFQQAYANVEKSLGCATSAANCGASVPSGGASNPAYAAYINSVAPQAFFEAMKSTGFCTGTVGNVPGGTPYASCTAAVLDQQLTNFETQAVWSLWSALDNGGTAPGFPFGHTMLNTSGQMSSGVSLNASTGHGNYNGGFISFGTHDWHGLTTQSNFTWSKDLGTGAVYQAASEYTQDDAYNLNTMYGEQPLDRRDVFNTTVVATEPWFKGQNGLLGRAAGGWTFAPVFTAGSGAPINCSTWTAAQSWGAGDGVNFADNEQCVFTTPYNAGHRAHFGVVGSGAVATITSTTPVNMFSNPVAVFNQVRAPILGIDTRNPGVGPILGLPYWNVDAQLKKDLRITESTSFELSFIATNMFNHTVFNPPTLNLAVPGVWGVLNSQAGSFNTPGSSREMEFGGRITF